MKKLRIYIVLILATVMLISCEKEVTVDLPEGKKFIVVEASINQLFPNLNYVFITKSIDYFNPDLSLFGVKDALVYITPGTIAGNDTTYDIANRIQLYDIQTIPGVDQFLNGFNGIYFNVNLNPQVGVPYLLEIDVEDQKITGTTVIPPVVEIDTLTYRINYDLAEGDTDIFVTFEFTDGPEQNNYRLFRYKSYNPLLIGWGTADFTRLFDDALLNNGSRPYSFFSPYDYSDTLNLYFTSIGRKEYLFWQSYGTARNNGGPFATPAEVTSTLQGAIGSFTGYGVSFRRVILQ